MKPGLRPLVGLAIGLAAAVVGFTPQGSAPVGASASLPAPAACVRSCWLPHVGTSWDWVLARVPRPPFADVAMYDIDGFDATSATVDALHRRGIHVICYISAGSWERWRPDAASYPRSVLGRPLAGWPGERWIDIRAAGPGSPLRAILAARVSMCARKGFDGVEFDNVDGYTNDTGFPLTASDQLRFNVMLANMAHAAGLSVLLKNDVGQVKALVQYFDGALDEQCNLYHECSLLEPFIAARKPVFNAEYQDNRNFCASDRRAGFDGAAYDLALDGRLFLPCAPPPGAPEHAARSAAR